MTLIGVLIVLIVAFAIIWAAATYLPVPFNYLVIGIVLVLLLALLINSVGPHAHIAAAS